MKNGPMVALAVTPRARLIVCVVLTTLTLTLAVAAEAFARDYYFSAHGDDAAGDGSRAAPYQSMARLNSLDLDQGDRVLLRAGDTFAGPILLDAGDSATDADGVLRGKPIRLLPFGGRQRPVIFTPHGNGLHAVDVGGIRIQGLELAGSNAPDEITATANASTGVLFENTNSLVQQRRVALVDVLVHGFGEAGVNFRAVNPAAATGGFADVRVIRCEIHSNGRAGLMSSVRSDTGSTVDGALYDFQSRAHARFFVSRNVVFDTFGKRESGGVSGSGIVLAQVATARMVFNVAHHNGGRAGGGGVAIWAWESDHVRIESNEAYANASFDGRDGGGFDLDGGTRHGLMQYNYSHGNHGVGYGLFEFGYASPMRDNVIRYNVSEDDGGGLAVWGNGPRSDGSGHVDAAAASLFYNNTIIRPRGPNAHFFGSVAEVGVYNNLFLSFAGNPVVQGNDFVASGQERGIDMLANAYWSDSDSFRILWENGTYTSLADWSAATRQETASGVLVGVQVDPGLSGPFNGGRSLNQPLLFSTLDAYRLLPTSALIDAGTSVADLSLPIALGLTDVGARDFYGGEVRHGTAFDIGTHER